MVYQNEGREQEEGDKAGGGYDSDGVDVTED
jgi:hypothetical protein